MKVEFLPEPGMLAAIAKEMRSTHRAYPVFSAAKMFLGKPALHRVLLTTLEPEVTLYQLGDGAISTDRSILERDAFRLLKDKYYREEVVQGEAPKGNFSNVARLRASGLLLGPTNHHAYQPALRRIYDERYKHRMPFAEFQQREIEVVTDEQAVNDWKEQARSTTTYLTTAEGEPETFKTLVEVEAHFRQTYLPQEIKTGACFEASGSVMCKTVDRSLMAALREAFDREMAFPSGVVNAMRPALAEANLTFFKHRKRVVYASAVRPARYPEGQPARESVLAILRTIEAHQRCTRRDLAVKLLGENLDAPERAAEKTELATDLHYLIHSGHVIEFVDGRFDLPLPPKALTEPGKPEAPAPATAEKGAAPAALPVAAAEISTPAPAAEAAVVEVQPTAEIEIAAPAPVPPVVESEPEAVLPPSDPIPAPPAD
ncbi:MAG: hypothetical protein ABMA13_17005 [Chthoniobacteraceae bacterium]